MIRTVFLVVGNDLQFGLKSGCKGNPTDLFMQQLCKKLSIMWKEFPNIYIYNYHKTSDLSYTS